MKEIQKIHDEKEIENDETIATIISTFDPYPISNENTINENTINENDILSTSTSIHIYIHIYIHI